MRLVNLRSRRRKFSQITGTPGIIRQPMHSTPTRRRHRNDLESRRHRLERLPCQDEQDRHVPLSARVLRVHQHDPAARLANRSDSCSYRGSESGHAHAS